MSLPQFQLDSNLNRSRTHLVMAQIFLFELLERHSLFLMELLLTRLKSRQASQTVGCQFNQVRAKFNLNQHSATYPALFQLARVLIR